MALEGREADWPRQRERDVVPIRAPSQRTESVVGLILVVSLLAACAPRWELFITQDGAAPFPVTARTWRELAGDFPDDARKRDALLLARVLWESGIEEVERLQLGEQDYVWKGIHEDSWLLKDGRVQIGDQFVEETAIRALSSPESSQVTARIVDLAPTIAGTLKVKSPRMTSGRALGAYEAKHVVLIVIDGLGYRRYQELRGSNITPLLDSLGSPKLALTVYPSVPQVGIAALLTGTGPQRNQVRARGTRDTVVETLFDVLTLAGKVGIAVEKPDPVFNLRHAETVFSRDGNGHSHSDSNTLENALEVIGERMPDLLWVHFYGLCQVGHTHGLYTDEEIDKLSEIDNYLHQIICAVPSGSLLLICSTHGMHRADDDDPSGNSGSLLPSDMLVPIWITQL